nr:class I SAM-dependent rRNA methyltransferase [Bacteroidales bacterium]
MKAKIYLKPHRDESVRRFHPWVFSGAIANVVGTPAEGDIVGVYSSTGEYLASGHWQIGSIAVRILSFSGDPESPAFWRDSLAAAYRARETMGLTSSRRTNCYRLVHGEGDGLPGLIVDWYDGVAVLQAHSVGMFRAKGRICEALQEVYGKKLKAVYDKSSGTAPFKAGLDLVDGYVYKSDDYSEGEKIVSENGHKFIVDWAQGQKTGFFLDQRENRALVERYSKGRNVLNLFCYTGGFSVYALGGGALHVDSVDSSARAIELASRNLDLNGYSAHAEFCADVKDYLGSLEAGRYDLMIVDPPAFAKHRGSLDKALRAYQRLN